MKVKQDLMRFHSITQTHWLANFKRYFTKDILTNGKNSSDLKCSMPPCCNPHGFRTLYYGNRKQHWSVNLKIEGKKTSGKPTILWFQNRELELYRVKEIVENDRTNIVMEHLQTEEPTLSLMDHKRFRERFTCLSEVWRYKMRISVDHVTAFIRRSEPNTNRMNRYQLLTAFFRMVSISLHVMYFRFGYANNFVILTGFCFWELLIWRF